MIGTAMREAADTPRKVYFHHIYRYIDIYRYDENNHIKK